MQGFNMELGYDKKVLVAHYIDELVKRFKIDIDSEDKEALVKETQNVVELIAKENLLSSQQLKQDTKDSLEKELATKEFVRSEVERAKTDLIKWIVGMQLAVGGLIVALIKFL
ncbi:hypothetical protein CUPS9163_05880 [Campylobacter upsaliensis]|uniref:hypothetical protein n=1 Tax=Campylobacter upsaliensis TaxID=28080 RepID=UPI002149A31E|nr:hypothetical protein [Campylobacter upsaliensis]MCR2091839.1 hypothetical protein [Campylobacter upsaliensis]